MKTILFIDNTAHHLYTQHHLYDSFAKMGYNIVLCCPDDGHYFQKMQQSFYHCLPFDIDGKSINPFKNFALILRLRKVLKLKRPDLIFSFTIKPNIYSAISVRRLKIPVVPNITGLGYVFLSSGLIHNLVVRLYRIAFSKLEYVIFQNIDDCQTFLDKKILASRTNIVQLPGSGVNLSKFTYVGYTNSSNEPITFLYSGRFLWDKGIGELIDAFRIVKAQYPNIHLKLIGNYFLANPSAISQQQVKLWQEELQIEYLGMVDNVSEIIAKCDCIVLPSYREGMPRAILEASSMGKPVITTDTVGCRDTVDNKVTGFLCKVKDPADLADKMINFINMPLAQKQLMGIAGRKKMEQEFNQNKVVEQYIKIAQTALS